MTFPTLHRFGFAPIGRMILQRVTNGSAPLDGISLDAKPPTALGIYAFVVDGHEVAYFGSAENLANRVKNYAYFVV